MRSPAQPVDAKPVRHIYPRFVADSISPARLDARAPAGGPNMKRKHVAHGSDGRLCVLGKPVGFAPTLSSAEALRWARRLVNYDRTHFTSIA